MATAMSDVAMWRTAKLLVEHYGSSAPAHVLVRAESLLAHGDAAGLADWRRILHATRALLQKRQVGAVR